MKDNLGRTFCKNCRKLLNDDTKPNRKRLWCSSYCRQSYKYKQKRLMGNIRNTINKLYRYIDELESEVMLKVADGEMRQV